MSKKPRNLELAVSQLNEIILVTVTAQLRNPMENQQDPARLPLWQVDDISRQIACILDDIGYEDVE